MLLSSDSIPISAFPSPAAAAGASAVPATGGSPRHFERSSEGDWRELMRDILAMANSGGGKIELCGNIDEIDVLDRLHRVSNSSFADVHVQESERAAAATGASTTILVGAADYPLAWYPAAGSAGLFYFRRHNRSEPATSDDMRDFIQRLLRRVRRRWLGGIRGVLSEPLPARTVPRKKRGTVELKPVRIVTDPDAPALQPQDVDRLYPWRQKDLLRELNVRIGRRALNSYDIQAVRRQHRLDERADFVFNLAGAGRRYSPAAADWIMQQYQADTDFFRKARAADQETLRLRRQKPR